MDLAELKKTKMLEIETLGIESEQLATIKKAINELTSAHNESELNVKYKLKAELDTEKETTKTLTRH